MPTVEYPTNPNTDTAFVTDDGGKRTRSLKTVLVDGTIDYPKNANVKDCYVTIDGKKQRALMTADVSKDGVVEYPDGSNSTKGYVTVDGKKHRVVLTAVLAGGAPDPVIAELNVTPSTSAQTITAPEGTDGYSPVNVSAVTSSIDANIQAGNIKKDVTILGVTGTLEGGSSGKYQFLERVKDDNNNEIGTVCGFYIDNTGNKFTIVCLDTQYRPTQDKQYLSNASSVSELPSYTHGDVQNTETATFNCDKILAYAAANNYTSEAVSACRSVSFTINGTRYYGQLPNMGELMLILNSYSKINNLDPTGPTDINPLAQSYYSSNQYSASNSWQIPSSGFSGVTLKTNSRKVIPVLEIPIA